MKIYSLLLLALFANCFSQIGLFDAGQNAVILSVEGKNADSYEETAFTFGYGFSGKGSLTGSFINAKRSDTRFSGIGIINIEAIIWEKEQKEDWQLISGLLLDGNFGERLYLTGQVNRQIKIGSNYTLVTNLKFLFDFIESLSSSGFRETRNAFKLSLSLLTKSDQQGGFALNSFMLKRKNKNMFGFGFSILI